MLNPRRCYLLSYLRKVVRSCKERIELHRRRKKAYRELIALDDSSLADIGISRVDIPYVVFGRWEPHRAPGDTRRSKASGLGEKV